MIAKEAPYQSQLGQETKDLVEQLIKQADQHHVETAQKIQIIR
jgi:hypothetical protein